MSHSQNSGSPAPGALGTLGKLRECVAAAQNLQHLVSSRSVGPKLLEQAVPDVIAGLGQWSLLTHDLTEFARDHLNLQQDDLTSFEKDAAQVSDRLLGCLNEAAQSPVRAKQRLTIERRLRSAVPLISSTLSDLELLIESTCTPGVPMSIEEFLSSTPSQGSNRPHRPVAIVGQVTDIEIATPARIGLRCLGALAGVISPPTKSELALHVHLSDDKAHLDFHPSEASSSSAQLPIFQPTAHTIDVIRAALKPYDGDVSENRQGITLRAQVFKLPA